MKLNIVILLFVAFIIISQDSKEKSTGEGVYSSGLQERRAWTNAPSLDSVNNNVNPNYGRVSGPFKNSSPESWSQMLPASGRQDASLVNINTVAQTSGVQYNPPTILEQPMFEPMAFNLK